MPTSTSALLARTPLARTPLNRTPLDPAPLDRTTPACAQRPELFQDPLLEEPPTTNASAADRRRHAGLVATAASACRGCPLMTACLHRAVVDHDVAGYVGGTTARQRVEIRRRLGIVVEPEDFDTLAGVLGGSRPVDHDEVLRLRAAHPDESLEVLAGRLGCSLSTVKRHLRRERTTPSTPAVRTPRPGPRQVLAAAAEVVNPAGAPSRAA